MSGVERPYRQGFDHFKAELLGLEKLGPPKDTPTLLPLSEIQVYEVLFQPRETSLTFRAGQSQKHVETMAQVVREGGTLDPLAVAAFGPHWVLLDGHHRRAAYLEADYRAAVPVEIHDSELVGEERIAWATARSSSLNSKNKLTMSEADKLDAAWRLTVVGVLSKADVHRVTGASKGSVGNMRRTRERLKAQGHRDSSLYAMTWRQALWELRRIEGAGDAEPHPEAHERKIRNLIRKLSPAFDGALTTPDLLEALEELRPGIGLDLAAVVSDRAVAELLEI